MEGHKERYPGQVQCYLAYEGAAVYD